MSALELEIFTRAIQPTRGDWPPEVARAILTLHLSNKDVERATELAEKRQREGLGSEEEVEIESYTVAGRMLELLKARARRSLEQAGLAA